MGHAIVNPAGILDGNSAGEMQQAVEAIIAKGETEVLIDFQDVTYMNSSAIGVLVATLKAVRASGKELFLCSLKPEVKIIFELTKMDQIFQVFSDRNAFESRAT